MERYDFFFRDDFGSRINASIDKNDDGDYVLYADAKAIEEENDRLKAELADLAYLALFHGIISRGRFAQLLQIDRADVDEKMAELAEAQGRKAVK